MKKGKIVKKVLAMLLCSALLVGILPVISPGIQVNADEEKLIDATCISWPGLEVWGVKENITSMNNQGCFTQSETPEIVLDFGKTAVINKIVTFPVMASADYYAKDYSFSVSTNGTTWTEVYSATDDVNTQTERVYTFDAVQARYVKMSVTECNGVYTDLVTFGLNGFFAYGFPKCEGTISSWTGLEMWGTSKANITNEVLGEGGWCFADQPNTQPVLDLGENKAIKYIVTWAPDATNNYYPKGYTFDVSTDNETWTTVYTVADEANTSLVHLYEITKTDARYIRLTTTTAANGNAGANFGLSGFFAYGFDAPNPTITQLEVSNITWPGTEVWGAKANVLASDNEACFTQSETPEIVLDLGKTAIVNKIVTKPIEASAEYYADDYAFLVSTDGTNWTTVYSVTGDTNDKAERVYAFDAVQARYVKMSATQCHGVYTDLVTFGLRGFYVYGTTKLDASGITWTGSAGFWNTNPSSIINDTRGEGGWAFSDQANAQPILDLGALCDIDYIVTWPCTNDNQYYPSGYTFEVSKDGETWTNVVTVESENNTLGTRIYPIVKSEARYIRMTTTTAATGYAGGNFGLSGFYAYGTQKPTEPEPPAPKEYAKIDLTNKAVTTNHEYQWGKISNVHDGSYLSTSRYIGAEDVSNPSFPVWVQVDLGKPYTVNKFVFCAWAANSDDGLPKDFTIEVSDDATNWTAVVTKTNYTHPDETNVNTFSFDEVECRYVRLNVTSIVQQTSDNVNAVNLTEIEVYGESNVKDYEKIDLSGKTITATEESQWGPATRLIDNSLAWDTSRYIGSSDDGIITYPVDITVALGGVYKINKFIFYALASDSDGGLPKDFEIQVSDDGEAWTTVVEKTDYTHQPGITNAFYFDAVECQYIRLSVSAICGPTFDSQNSLNLVEIEAYGIEVKDYAKIDLSGKTITATEESQWGPATRLIDNSLAWDTSRYIGSSDDGIITYPVDITVDLGAKHKINKFIFYALASDSDGGVPKDFKIQVSDDGDAWTTVVEKTNYTHQPGITNTFKFDEVECQYVRLSVSSICEPTFDSQNSLNLVEIEVYGESLETPEPPVPPTEYEKIDLSDKTLSSNHSYENWGITIGNLKDGDFSATSRYIGATEAELGGDLSAIYPVWIQADLGSSFTVNKFIFYSREADSDNGLPKDFTIEVSSDGETWTTVVTKTDYTHAAGITNTFYFDEVVCQYIRLNVSSICAASNDGINALGLVEIEVYGKAYVEPVEYDPIDLSGAGVTSNHSLENWGITIANLTDGDLSATSRYVGATEAELSGDLNAIYPVWIQVDLLETYKVNEFSFYNREDNCDNGLPKDFTIEVSTNGTDWTTVVTKTNYTHAETIKNTFIFDEVEIRYIRLNVTAICAASNDGINAIGLVEIEVCGQKVTTEEFHLPEHEISIYGKITSVSHQYERNTAKHLNDSDTSTSIIIKENNGKRATGMIPVWIKMDLKGSKTISGIRLSAYNTSTHGGFPTDFDIQVSNNGTSWTTVKTVTEVPNPEDVVLGVYTFNFDATTVKYVRIYVRNVGGVGDKNIGYTVHLREFEVLNGDTAYDYSSYVKNITTWKAGEGINYCWASGYSQDVISASTSYEMWGWGVAALIDGSTDGLSTFATADSSISKPVSRLEDYVTVDLKTAYDITQMAFARVDTSSMKGVPTEFVLYGSLDGQEWYTLITRDTVKASSAHDEWFVFDVKDVKAVRYLRLEIKGVETEYSDELGLCAALAELKFFGTRNSAAMDAIYGEKIDLTKATLRATHSYGLWGHGIGNLYDEDKASTLFIATSEDDANYWARYKDEKTFKNETNEYIIIRLDGVYTVGRMKFESWWEAAGLGVPKAFTLEGSLDGESWYTIYDNKTTTVSETSWYNFRFTNANARYLRLRFHSVIEACDLGWVAALRELQFYGYLVEKDPSAADVQLPPAPSEDEFKNPYEKEAPQEESHEESEPESQQESEQESHEEPETENWFAKIWKAIVDFFASLFGGKKN